MEEIFKGMAARLGDKTVGLVTYLVLFLDLLGLRSTAGKAISAAYHVADDGILSFRVAVARIIAKRLGYFMYWYAGALFAVMAIALMLRFWTGEDSQPLWSGILFFIVTVVALARIIWSACNQIRWGDGDVLHWLDPRNKDQYTRDGGTWQVRRKGRGKKVQLTRRPDTDKLVPVYGDDHHPLRVSFYRSGVQLMVATAVMGAALFVVGIMVARVVTAVASWIVVNASRLTEATGELMAQPLAALPGLTLENLKEQLFSGGRLNLVDEEEGAVQVDSICPFITRSVLTYLILVFATGASQRWALGLGVFLGLSQLASAAYVSDGYAESVEYTISKRRRFLRWVYDWAPVLAVLSVFGDWLMEQFLGTSVGQWCTRVVDGQVYLVGNHSLWYLIPLLFFFFCLTAYFVQLARETDWSKKWKALGIILSALALVYTAIAISVRMDNEDGWTPFGSSKSVVVKDDVAQALAKATSPRASDPPAPQDNGARGQTPVVQRPRRAPPSRYAACQTGQCGASYQESRRQVKELARKWDVE
jgi:hypothetical protein